MKKILSSLNSLKRFVSNFYMEKTKTDHLKEDPVLAGQDWVSISFVAPEDMVLKKNIYYVNNYLVSEVNQSLSAQAQHMAKFLAAQMRKKMEYTLDKLATSVDEDDRRLHKELSDKFSDMIVDEDEFVTECRRRYDIDEEEIMDKYKIYLVKNRTQLDSQFDEAHDDQTSVRGIKVRGTFASLKKAEERSEAMREFEPAVHTFVAPVGKWLPLDVNADEAQDQKHMLGELNDFMHKHYESVTAGQMEFDKRKGEMTKGAKREAAMNTKQRLQARLREQKRAKMRAEVDEMKNLASAESATITTTKIKKKKHRKRKSKKTTEE